MIYRFGHCPQPDNVDGVLVGLGRITNRAAREQPNRDCCKFRSVLLNEFSGSWKPVTGVHTASYDRGPKAG